MSSSNGESDNGLPFSESIESFYADLFQIDFTQPVQIRNIDSISTIAPSDSSSDPQSTTADPSIPCVDTTSSFTTEFLNMVGNSTQFADHLRSTLLLSIAARKIDRSKRYYSKYHPSDSAATRHILQKTWSTILSRVLTHFNIICEHYNLAACRNFNLSDFLHRFFYPFSDDTATSHKNKNYIFGCNRYQLTKTLSHFNDAHLVFLLITLPTAFRASPMHSDGGVIFPLIIPPDQADTFTQHYTQLLDSPIATSISSSTNSTHSTKLPTSGVPFSIFAYLGLLDRIMIDLWSDIASLISLLTCDFSSRESFGTNVKNLTHLFLSSPYLPDGVWSRTIGVVSGFNLDVASSLFEQVDLIQIMSNKLHSIIRFPLSSTDPSSSLVTYSSQSIINAMLSTMSSLLSHKKFKSSSFYTNPALYQQFTYFSLQVMYIYLVLCSSSSSSSFFEGTLQSFQNIFHSQRHNPAVIDNYSNLSTPHIAPPSLSPHLFLVFTSLIARSLSSQSTAIF